ncbi:MAG: hypothetical protein WCK09_06840 [Bacteroidota bacterium]
MIKIVVFFVTCLITATMTFSYSQVGFSTDNSLPDNSAILDVKSTSKGLLPPRMSFTARRAILNPAAGLVVFCTDGNPDGTGTLSIFQGGHWLSLHGECTLPVTPANGYPVPSNTQVIWKWSAVPIATGYKWNTTSNFATATDMGASTLFTETGLTQGTTYTRYVWAYNACGNSTPLVLSCIALNCGNSFTLTHTAGNVAPVTKTVTYGTVTNIPGETSKCWITRNLGATQQANTVNDNSEAAAGWYWQFNQLQGYKHDGTTVTPAWSIVSIFGSSDWEISHDPCTGLLGSAWRIPTYTEWNNVYISGGWNTWNGPWSSGLQLHAAGYLNNQNGSLINRGTYGFYVSSTQYSSTYAWHLYFLNSVCRLSFSEKADGHTLRCIRD